MNINSHDTIQQQEQKDKQLQQPKTIVLGPQYN